MGISYGGISQLFTAQLQPAEPGRDLAAVGDRRDADHALPGRHPQHGLRRRLGQGAPAGGQAGRRRRPARSGPTSGSRSGDQTCKDNQALHGRGRRPDQEDPRERPLPAQGRRPARAGHVRPQDQRADVHGLPVRRRADRRPLPDARRALHRHGQEVVHVHQRHARRLARPRDLQPLVRLPRALRRQTGADRERRADPGGGAARLPGGDGHRRRDAAARPDPAGADLRRRRWRRSRSCRRSGSCSTTAPAARTPASRYPGFEQSFASFPIPGTKARSWFFGAGRRAAATSRRRKRRRRTRSPGTRTRGR